MWVISYVKCLLKKHVQSTVYSEHALYHYCLRCGKVEKVALAVQTAVSR